MADTQHWLWGFNVHSRLYHTVQNSAHQNSDTGPNALRRDSNGNANPGVASMPGIRSNVPAIAASPGVIARNQKGEPKSYDNCQTAGHEPGYLSNQLVQQKCQNCRENKDDNLLQNR